LLAVYILWGSTAPAIKIAVQSIPPFDMAALRFLIAGGILWCWVRLRREPLPTVRDWRGAAITGTTLLTLIQRRYPATHFLQMSSMQMLVGFVELSVLGALSGERLSLAEFTPAATAALAFLIVFGSIVGFSAFIWLTRNVETVLASTYSYVNPIVAIVISVLLLHEPLTWHTLLGATLILAGVALMIRLAPRGGAGFAALK